MTHLFALWWNVSAGRGIGEHMFDSWYHVRCTDEVRESNMIADGVPGGAHPTAGAPSLYLEDESR
jgi:hypothetical protein